MNSVSQTRAALSIGSSIPGEVASSGSCPKAHRSMLPLAPQELKQKSHL